MLRAILMRSLLIYAAYRFRLFSTSSLHTNKFYRTYKNTYGPSKKTVFFLHFFIVFNLRDDFYWCILQSGDCFCFFRCKPAHRVVSFVRNEFKIIYIFGIIINMLLAARRSLRTDAKFVLGDQ